MVWNFWGCESPHGPPWIHHIETSAVQPVWPWMQIEDGIDAEEWNPISFDGVLTKISWCGDGPRVRADGDVSDDSRRVFNMAWKPRTLDSPDGGVVVPGFPQVY